MSTWSHNDVTADANDNHESIIRPVARKGYGTVALEGEGSNCFSIIQLVGQKRQ